VGIGEAAYGPAAPTIISDHFAAEHRGRMLSFFYVAIPVGSAIGYAFGGVIGQHYGWRWPFYLVALPGLILAGLCLGMRDPRGPRSRAERHQPPIKVRDIVALFQVRSYLLNTAAMTAMTFAIGGISFWLPRYLFDYRAADFGNAPSLGRINLIFGAITVVAGLIATLLGGMVADRVQRRFASAYFLVSGIAILFSFPAIIAMLRVPFPWAWILIFVGVFFLFFNTGPSNAALANVAPPAIRATAFALNIFIIHAFGDAISPPLIGWIAGRWNMDAAFIVMAAVTLLASIFWIWGARYLGRDTALAEARLG
jgi:MFS family permease